MADIGSLDYDLKRDVSALCQMVEDDYPEESVYHRYGVILSNLSALVVIGRRAREAASAAEKFLMVQRLKSPLDGVLISAEELLDAGFELPADAPEGALYRMKEVRGG